MDNSNHQMCCTCSNWSPMESKDLFEGKCGAKRDKITDWHEDDCGLWEDYEHIGQQTMRKSNILSFIQVGMRVGFNKTALDSSLEPVS